MRSDHNVPRFLVFPNRGLAFALAIATASAAAPLAGSAQSRNETVITAQSHSSQSQELRTLAASGSSADLPDEPKPRGQDAPYHALESTTGESQIQFEGGSEAGLPRLSFTRALGIFPVAKAPSTHDTVTPLSAGEKFQFFVKPTFDPSIAVVAVLGTLLSPQSTSPPAFGGGAAAYGQKAGAIAADYALNNLFAKALLPTVLHQDPRFFRKEDGSVISRFMYGISRPFVTRTDDGHNAVNTSYLGGATMTIALSNAYYPERDRKAAVAAARYGEVIGIDAAVNVIREFLKLAH